MSLKLPGWTDTCEFASLLVPKTAFCLQTKCGALQLDDKSRYTVLPPRIWGIIPRLASQLHIEQVHAIISRKAKQGLMLSVELLDCAAAGFQGEPGNFICRSAFTSLGLKLPGPLSACFLSVVQVIVSVLVSDVRHYMSS